MKKATFKVKQQNGTLKKLHKKIITYERLVGEVRKKSQVELIKHLLVFNSILVETRKETTPAKFIRLNNKRRMKGDNESDEFLEVSSID